MSLLNTTATGLAVAVGLVLAGMLLLALGRPIIVRLGLRNIPRRPTQSALIVVGLTLSTLIIVSALSLGDTLNRSVQRHAIDAYGQIDQVVSPSFLGDLVALAGDGTIDSESEEARILNSLAVGDLASVVTLFEDGLPGISEERYDRLRAQLAVEPLIDGVAASIVFPTIVRNVNTGQGEPLGFIFAVDGAYDAEFGLHSIDGSPVHMADLQPGVGNIFIGAANLFAGTQNLLGNAGAAFGAEDVGVTEAVLAIAAAGALLTAEEGPSVTLDDLRLDVATLRGLGFDTSFLEAQGIDVLSLEALGLTDEQLRALGIDPAAPITLPTLRSLGLDVPDPATATTNLLSAINLNTLGRQIDATLARYGLQLRQGDVYLNRLGAQQLDARPGDLLEIFVGPIPVPYRVRAIVEESGPLGALTPVVMLDIAEAQKLLFMPGRVNSILISNQGDELTGMQHTDAVGERLRVLSYNEEKLAEVLALLHTPGAARAVQREAPRAKNPMVGADGAPDFLVDLIEGVIGVQGFDEQVQTLAVALTEENDEATDRALREALASPAVREWLLGLPLPRQEREALEAAFADLDDFQVLSPLSKQFAVQAADVAGVAFGSMFSVSGIFSIFAGVLLIFLIFVMLAAERRSELGIARAVGMHRRHLVQMFVTEGLVYDLASALLGLGLGLLVSYAMVGFVGGLFENISRQVGDRSNPFQLRFSVAPTSVVIAYCLGVLLTFVVVTLASWQVSRLNIVSAIRNLPDTGSVRHSRLGAVGRWAFGPLLLLGGLYTLWQWSAEGQTVTLMGATLALVGTSLTAGRLLALTPLRAAVRERLVHSVIGAGLLLLWAVPWSAFTDLRSVLFRQNPAFLLLSFALSGPLVIIGAILVVMFNADALAGAVARPLGGIGAFTPVLRTAIAYPLNARFRTGVTMLLFAMVITTVTVMSIVIQATQIITTPDEQRTAGFDIKLSPGVLSFFDPVLDLGEEAAIREDYPAEDVAVAGSVARLLVEGRQVGAGGAVWGSVGLTGVDAGYVAQAQTVYSFRLRAEGYGSDQAVWQALAERDDVAIVSSWRVAQRRPASGDEFDHEHGFRRLQLTGFTLEDQALPQVEIQVRTADDAAEAIVTRTLRVIGVLAQNDTLADGSVQVNRRLLDALNGEPVRPEVFYVKVRQGADAKGVAQTLERSLLSGGLNATVLAEEFAIGQAVTRGILRLFQGFLGLGLLVGIAGLGVISGRTVVERRQQVGMLRAIGYQPEMVALAFVLEASFIALTGIGIGAATGIVLGDKMIGQFYTVATEQVFPIPWLQIAAMLLLAYAFSLLTTILPAYQASRIYPAEALRYE